jgi:hypothetical protein
VGDTKENKKSQLVIPEKQKLAIAPYPLIKTLLK